MRGRTPTRLLLEIYVPTFSDVFDSCPFFRCDDVST
jgi:hypothetical protein